jgi:NADPH-dependent ferric siderophore reductase
MLTFLPQRRVEARFSARNPVEKRPNYRPYAVSVARVQRLSPSFTRITFAGPELEHFGTEGLDQRVKLVLPLPKTGLIHFPFCEDWFALWRNLDEAKRNPLRTYTVLEPRPDLQEIDIDFVRHGDEGKAARWLNEVTVGSEVAIVGPDARGENPRVGIEWNPRNAHTFLLAGDETAVPAIGAILANMDREARGVAFIEIPDQRDIRRIDAPAGVEVRWLARSVPDTTLLGDAIRQWAKDLLASAPESDRLSSGGLYCWLAGESSRVTAMRRCLVSEVGVNRQYVTFMGYWRAGRSEN